MNSENKGSRFDDDKLPMAGNICPKDKNGS